MITTFRDHELVYEGRCGTFLRYVAVEEVLSHNNFIRTLDSPKHEFENKEEAILFRSSYNGIPVEQFKCHLITRLACSEKQIALHETGSVQPRYPALRKKKNTAALPLVFRLKNSSHLPVYVDNKEEQERPRKAEQERAAAVWSDCQSSIEEVPNGPSGSQGRGSQAGGVSLNKTEFT